MINISKSNPKGIVWIASYPRSGNTWVRAFLHALLQITANPTVSDIDIGDVGKWSVSERALSRYTPLLGKPAASATPAEIAAVRPRVQANIATAAPGIVFVKTHNANGRDFGVPLINTSASAGAIYLVRNPLDVVISYAAFSGATIDKAIETMALRGWCIESTTDTARVVTGSWTENVASWTDHPNAAVLVLRYEDLVATPEKTFGRIARHLRMKPNPRQLRRAIEITSFDSLRAKEAASGFAEKPKTAETFFRAGRIGEWRERLAADQIAAVVASHGRMMERFGYLPDEAGATS